MTTPDFTARHFIAQSAAWRTDRYYTYDLMSEVLHGWVAEYPDLAALDSIGPSAEGRAIRVVTITNRATGPDLKKPAYYVDANRAYGIRPAA